MDLLKSLKRYVNVLQNTRNFEVYEPLVTEGEVTVTMKADKWGTITVQPAETYETDVESLQGEVKDAKNELKQAKKTIGTQETEIENLTAQVEAATATTQETEEVTVDEPKTKRRRIKQVG